MNTSKLIRSLQTTLEGENNNLPFQERSSAVSAYKKVVSRITNSRVKGITYKYGLQKDCEQIKIKTVQLLLQTWYRFEQCADFIIYFLWEESCPISLDRLFLSKIFIVTLKLFVQKLEILAVIDFQIYRFSYLLCIGGATSTTASSPIFAQNIYIETVVTCTNILRYLAVIFFPIYSFCYQWAWHLAHLKFQHKKQPITPSRHTGRCCENFEKIGSAYFYKVVL